MDPWGGLARAAAAGDTLAMRRLIEAVSPSVFHLIRSILGACGVDAEDTTQESLLAFVGALPAFRGESTVLHYACRIAVRTAVAARRRSLERDERLIGLAVSLAPSDPLPGEPAVAARRRALVRALLDELPEAQAETIALRVVLGCSLPEVAEATGVSTNTVRSRMRLAKEALRRRIEEDPALLEMLEVAG